MNLDRGAQKRSMKNLKGAYVKFEAAGVQLKLQRLGGTQIDQFWLVNQKQNLKISLHSRQCADDLFEINMDESTFSDLTHNFRFVICAQVDGQLYQIVNVKTLGMPTWARYFNPLAALASAGRDVIPYMTPDGILAVYLCKKVYADGKERGLIAKQRLDEIIDAPQTLTFVVQFKPVYPQNLNHISGITLSYRRSDATVDLQPQHQAIERLNGWWEIRASFNKSDISNEIYSDSYILIVHADKNQLNLTYQVNAISRKFYQQLHRPYRDVFKINAQKKLLVQVAFNKALWIHYRDLHQVDLPEVREREAQALRRYRPNQKNGNIIIFEKEAQMAQDNGFALFCYLQTTSLAEHTFYVIDTKAPQAHDLAPWASQILPLFSDKYYQHLIEDQMLVASESIPHVYQFNFNFGNIIELARQKNNYFLQHGVVGIRKLGDVFKYHRSGYDYINSSTNHERQLIQTILKYPRRRINTFGLPRWEKLTPQLSQRMILYFPTWREKLAYLTDEEFLQSDYFLAIQELISSPILQDLLKENHYQLKVFLHPKMRRFSKYLGENEQIMVTDSSQEALGQVIHDADAVISDYSSMVWDFAYQRKPIILFQFDQAEYEQQWNGFFDKTIWKFGPVVINLDALLVELTNLFQNNCQMGMAYRQAVDAQLADITDINAKHTQFIRNKLSHQRPVHLNLSSWQRLSWHYFLVNVRQYLRMLKRRILSVKVFWQ